MHIEYRFVVTPSQLINDLISCKTFHQNCLGVEDDVTISELGLAVSEFLLAEMLKEHANWSKDKNASASR